MSKFRHNICTQCWMKKNQIKNPIKMKIAESENCCFCGKINHDGIYIREDPDLTLCKGEHHENSSISK